MNTAKTSNLALVTYTGCNLHIDISPRDAATLHSLGMDGQDKIVPTASHSLPPGPNLMSLNPGLYHLQVQHGASCTVIGGQCSIVVVTDGEDPWPVPPLISSQPPFAFGASPATPGHAFLTNPNHLREVRSYFSGL